MSALGCLAKMQDISKHGVTAAASLQAFYAAVDSFHTAYDALTEFESLNLLASELVPGRGAERATGQGVLLLLLILHFSLGMGCSRPVIRGQEPTQQHY
jgi:hypothetical protein